MVDIPTPKCEKCGGQMVTYSLLDCNWLRCENCGHEWEVGFLGRRSEDNADS